METYDDTTKAQTWRELEWMRYNAYKGKLWHRRSRTRKIWWAKFTYRAIFNELPQDWMLSLTPKEPSVDLRRLVTRRDNAFKREVKNERAAKNGRDAPHRGVEPRSDREDLASGDRLSRDW